MSPESALDIAASMDRLRATSDSAWEQFDAIAAKMRILRAAIEAAESRRVDLGSRSSLENPDWQAILSAAGVVDSLKGNG